MSHTLFKDWVVPELSKNAPTLLVVIDNLRYDQWKSIEPAITPYFKKSKERTYYSILPTATQYARNAIFSGLMPSEMERLYPDLWRNDTDEGGKNQFEAEFLEHQIRRLGLDISWEYHKSCYIFTEKLNFSFCISINCSSCRFIIFKRCNFHLSIDSFNIKNYILNLC